jgi:hypothetical protein
LPVWGTQVDLTVRAVRFLRHCGADNAGEIATFSDPTAQRYVERGVAAFVSNDPLTLSKIDAPAEPEPASRTPAKVKAR